MLKQQYNLFTRPPSPALRDYTNIVDSLDAIQKVWDENERKSPIREDKHKEDPPTTTEPEPETVGQKHSESWTSTGSSTSSDDALETPPTEAEEQDDDDELVAKIVANLEAKIRAVKKRKRLAVEVENLRRELIAKEIELKECDRILTLEMGQIGLPRKDSGMYTSSQEI